MSARTVRRFVRHLSELIRRAGLVAVSVAVALSAAAAEQAPEGEDKAALSEAAQPGPSFRYESGCSTAQSPSPFEDEIVKAARAHDLPVHFFRRLIWQESRFRPHAVSPAGAQGIAQFMPGTAQWRGLADPFEPCQALRESARWLRELWSQFGNLGLAAAAYNAGPNRVTRWLSGRTTLPSETRAYVQIITGEVAERWTECRSEPESKQSCPDVYAGATVPPARINVVREAGAHGPWGLQLAGDWSEARALSEFQKLQTRFPSVLGDRKAVVLRSQIAGRGSAPWYRVRVAEATRERANELCARLERVGGRCIVLRN